MTMAESLPTATGFAGFEPRTWLALGLLGFWTGLDATAFLQILISQPLVAAWMGGFAAGDPAVGLAVGLALQGLWSRAMPMGASPIPATGPAALAAGALAAAAGGERASWGPVLAVPEALPLAVALLVGLALAAVSRPMLAALPRHRSGVLHRALAAAETGRPAGVIRANLLGALPSGALGLALTGIGALVGSLILGATAGIESGDGRWVAVPVLAVGLGHTASLAGSRRARGWSVAALGLGLLILGLAA